MDKRIGCLLLVLFVYITVSGQQKQAPGKARHFKKILINYQENKLILDLLLLIPDSAMTSWTWPLKARKALVDSVRKYNNYTDNPEFNHISILKPHYLNLQVADGSWSIARYGINEKDCIAIANTTTGDGNFTKVFEYINGKLKAMKRETVIGSGSMLLHSLLKKDSPECRSVLASVWGYENYDFSVKNKLIITAWPLTRNTGTPCFKGNRMTFAFNPLLKKFELESTSWKDPNKPSRK